MAKVQVQVAGGSIQQKEADCICDLAELVGAEGYQATVNGEPVDKDHELEDFDFVSFAKPVKAGSEPELAVSDAGPGHDVHVYVRKSGNIVWDSKAAGMSYEQAKPVAERIVADRKARIQLGL